MTQYTKKMECTVLTWIIGESKIVGGSIINWCGKCNYPTKEKECCICGNKTKQIATDLRPVFKEEKALISAIDDINYTSKNIWSSGTGAYIIDGVRKSYSIKKLNQTLDFKLLNEKYNYYKEIGEECNFDKFIIGNKKRLDTITYESEKYVRSVAGTYKDYQKIISWSGGKDSTVISDIVINSLNYLEEDIYFVHGDTTLEFRTTEEYIETFFSHNKYSRYPLLVARSDKNFMELCNDFGPPSRVMSWCCSIFKTGPISQMFNEVFPDEKILTFYGIRKSESASRSKYERTVRSPKITRQIVASPIIEWSDLDVWTYIISNEIPFNEAYRFGFGRVGCLYCPNNGLWSEFLSKIYFKQETDEWKEFLYGFAKKIGKKDFEVYIDEGYWKARQGGNGIDKEYNEVISNECQLSDNSKNYILSRNLDDSIFELFKPLGNLSFIKNDDIFEVTVKTEEQKIVLKGKYGSKLLNVTIEDGTNSYLIFQRIDCQLRKYQYCILCSGCDSVCPVAAISTQEFYLIDEDRCIKCGKCITRFAGGCLLSQSLVKSRNQR